MESNRFTKPIREAVEVWARTFNPVDLAQKIEQNFRLEVEAESRRITAENKRLVDQAVAQSESDRKTVQPLKDKNAALEKELFLLRQRHAVEIKLMKDKYDDLQAIYAAVQRSAAVAR